jgi:hypothetical protein
VHLNDLTGVDNFNPSVRRGVFVQFRLHPPAIADEKQALDMAVFAQSVNSSGNDVLGGEIPTHRIDGEFHRGITRR